MSETQILFHGIRRVPATCIAPALLPPAIFNEQLQRGDERGRRSHKTGCVSVHPGLWPEPSPRERALLESYTVLEFPLHFGVPVAHTISLRVPGIATIREVRAN